MVQITPSVTNLARNRVAIGLKIEEGKTTKITDINIEGNERYSDRSLITMSPPEGGLADWNTTKADQFNQENSIKTWKDYSSFIRTTRYFTPAFVNTGRSV